MNDAVKQTLLSRVYDVAIRTPLEPAQKLTDQLGFNVYLKREDLQPVHSFKLRGAYNKMALLSDVERKQGVIAASAGNHAQGVALAAMKLGMSALIIMPHTTPDIKIDAVRSYGAEVELAGDSYSDAAQYAKQRTTETGRTYIHPFDDPLVIAGQGTVGYEIIDQLPDVTHIFVPVGGGGLIAGIAQYVKALRPDVKVIGVEPEDSNALQASLQAKYRVVLPHVGIFADGVAVKQVGEVTFAICQELVDDSITVSTDELCAAIKAVFEETRSIVEPAGALGVAGIIKYAAMHDLASAGVVAICSGANMPFERLQLIAERALLGGHKEALFAITLEERPGVLYQFCKDVIGTHNITQFGYRLNQRDKANVFVGISINDSSDKARFISRIEESGYQYADLSNENVTKEHVRYMIGGSLPESESEHLYEIRFPERPGALRDFLSHVGSNWNISLFHYRGMGSDTGRVFIGFETQDGDMLESKLIATGYDFVPAASRAANIFLGLHSEEKNYY